MFCTCSDLKHALLVDAFNLFLLGSRLANMGAMPVAPGARSAGGRCLPCALLCSVFVAALFPVGLVIMNKV